MLSFQDIPPLLDRLDKMRTENPGHITFTYQKMFGTPEGELILIDLMDHFFEFKPQANMTEVGSHAVIIYIKNRLLGVTEPPQAKIDEINQGEEHA